MDIQINTIIQGDCLTELKKLPDNSVDCCITSPPYYGLRDYGTAKWEGGDPNCDHKIQTNIKEPNGDWDRPSRIESNKVGELLECVVCHKSFVGKIGNKFCSTKCLNTLSNEERTAATSKRIDTCKCGAKRIDNQLGLEKTPEEYVAKMVEVFREVKRILKKEGTLWLNLGDSYATQHTVGTTDEKTGWKHGKLSQNYQGRTGGIGGFVKAKDLVGILWRTAFALQQNGWYLRQDIIWHKPNPMPESVTDRCTKSHEYVFLLAKSPKYYFDNEAIKEDALHKEDPRAGYGRLHYRGKREGHKGTGQENFVKIVEKRNRRSVWTITTKPFKEAHFATFPEDLITPMVLAGCPKEGIVLDPFMGAGTTAVVARKLGRNYLGIELNEKYIEIANRRLAQQLIF